MFDGLILALSQLRHHVVRAGGRAGHRVRRAGFPIAEEFAAFIRGNQRFLELVAGLAGFLSPRRNRSRSRRDLPRAHLARTLRALVAVEKKAARQPRKPSCRAVRDYFYKGALAHRIADFFGTQRRPDRLYAISPAFTPRPTSPRTTTYRGYEIVKPGFWTQGPVMLEALNLLEGYDLHSMGHNSPEYLHTVVEAVKLAFADRDRYYGDPKFSHIPEEILLVEGVTPPSAAS